MKNAAQRGARIVLADLRITDLGKHACRTLHFRANTDVAMLNALMQTITEENFQASDFTGR